MVLAVVALLAVTSPPEGSPALLGAAEPAEPVYDTPALPPLPSATPTSVAVAPSAVGSAAPAAGSAAAAAGSSAAAVPAPAPASAPPAAAAPAAPAAAAPPAAPPMLPVLVLNNSREPGLAARAAARFSRAGWPVRRTGNFTGRIRATTVYYEAGQRASAERFAATFRGIPRVLPRPENIPGPRGLTVVLTRDFPA